jgi:hypothetical protein
VLSVCEGANRLLVVGIEADALDALIACTSQSASAFEMGLVVHSTHEVAWERVLGNFGGRIVPVELSSFQRWAGRRSVLLTFAYGTHGHATHVAPEWLRVSGPDVRTQFRSLVAWEVLGVPMAVYPRWLVEVARDEFTDLLEGARVR